MKKLKMMYRFMLILFIVFSCNNVNKNNQVNYNTISDYQELSSHLGTDKYEVLTIIQKESKVNYLTFDTIRNFLYADSFYKGPSEFKSKTIRISVHGSILDENKVYDFLSDGTMWKRKGYQLWVINDDKTIRKYYQPLNKKEMSDFSAWLPRFKELYQRADMVHVDKNSGNYYMKIDNRMFDVWANYEEFYEINDSYPEKGKSRFVKLPDLTPDFLSRKERLENTSLMEYITYEQVESEPGEGFNPIGFSGGYHYIDLHMPGGDTIKFKRYGSMGVNIKTYKIPEEYGGRDDVIFIHQQINPNPALVNGREWGGMYVVRPRGLGVGE